MPVELRENRGENINSMFMSQAENDLPGDVFLQIVQHSAGIALDPQNFNSIFNIDFPGLGGTEKMFVSVKELDSQLFFQFNETLVKTRLRDKKRFRRLGNTSFFCDCDNIFQLF